MLNLFLLSSFRMVGTVISRAGPLRRAMDAFGIIHREEKSFGSQLWEGTILR